MANDISTLQFSWSSFELYEQCPFKFYQKYIVGKTEPTNIFALYGCAFHTLLDHLYSTEKFNSKYAYAIWDKMLQKEYTLKYKEKQYSEITQDQVDKIKYLGFKHIKNFFELAISEGLLKPPMFTEQTVKGNYKTHKLVCKIDLGLVTKYGKTLLDWKTGEADKKHFYQLVLYSVLAEKKLGEKIEAIAPVYIKSKQIAYRQIDSNLKLEVSNYLSKLYQTIISDKIFAPKVNKYCKNCYLHNLKICSMKF